MGQLGIVNSPIIVNKFELKLDMIQMAKENAFNGHPTYDPQKHRRLLIEICGTIKITRVSSDAIDSCCSLFLARSS